MPLTPVAQPASARYPTAATLTNGVSRLEVTLKVTTAILALAAGVYTYLGVRELLRFEADRAWQNYKEGAELLNLIDPESRGTLWLLTHTYSALLARIESLDFAVFGERVRLSRAEKMLFIAQARFGRVTEENIIEKCDRDRRRPGGAGSRRRAS